MPQLFRAQAAPPSSTAVYQISIRAPGAAFAELSTYTFPLTPSSLRKSRPAMSSFTDTQSQAGSSLISALIPGYGSSQGVQRVMDRYGLAPPIITIEGTTGWDYHLSDGFVITGLQSIQLLLAFLNQYAALN